MVVAAAGAGVFRLTNYRHDGTGARISWIRAITGINLNGHDLLNVASNYRA